MHKPISQQIGKKTEKALQDAKAAITAIPKKKADVYNSMLLMIKSQPEMVTLFAAFKPL